MGKLRKSKASKVFWPKNLESYLQSCNLWTAISAVLSLKDLSQGSLIGRWEKSPWIPQAYNKHSPDGGHIPPVAAGGGQKAKLSTLRSPFCHSLPSANFQTTFFFFFFLDPNDLLHIHEQWRRLVCITSFLQTGEMETGEGTLRLSYKPPSHCIGNTWSLRELPWKCKMLVAQGTGFCNYL